jgi:hypothetical protein
MHILIALIGAAIAAYFFFYRARNAADVATDMLDLANDVRLAARRFGFSRKANVHPVESTDDSRILTTAAALAFLELDDLPTAEQRADLVSEARSQLALSQSDAEEMQVLGRWLVSECGSAQAAVSRLTRRLNRVSGQSAMEPLLRIVNNVVARGPAGGLSERQRDAIEDIRLAFKVR